MGVISGGMLVDGRERDMSFQRKTGYVQQQDLHLSTSTVREALNFSALLRQPAKVPRKEKLEYVNEVIKLLDMEEYADAVVGVPGEGLNVEQRKRLTIGVELAAKPELLLFLDEPTSGLDSQTSWAICDLMEKLTKNGQAVLCTVCFLLKSILIKANLLDSSTFSNVVPTIRQTSFLGKGRPYCLLWRSWKQC